MSALIPSPEDVIDFPAGNPRLKIVSHKGHLYVIERHYRWDSEKKRGVDDRTYIGKIHEGRYYTMEEYKRLFKRDGSPRTAPKTAPVGRRTRKAAEASLPMEGQASVNPADFWRELHPLAEVSGSEHRTAACVARHLRAMGVACREGVGGTGVVGVIEGAEPGPTVLFRADMDALPYSNLSGTEPPTVAIHACGHDAHMSMLLAAVPEFRRIVKKGTLKLIFQPAEETLQGALAMIRDGVLEGADIAIAGHIRPKSELEPGCFSPALSHMACATVEVTFFGVPAHAGRPHLGINPVSLAAGFVAQAGLLEFPPAEGWSLKATRIASEPGATNTLAAWTRVSYDIRAATNPTLDAQLDQLKRLAERLSEGLGTRCDFLVTEKCPASENDPELEELIADTVRTTFGADRVRASKSLGGGEDFHFYKAKKPSLRTGYFGIGAGAEPGMHDRNMRFPLERLSAGTRLWTALAGRLLG